MVLHKCCLHLRCSLTALCVQDPLRVVRMARYAGRYSFAIEQEALLQAQSPEVRLEETSRLERLSDVPGTGSSSAGSQSVKRTLWHGA
jgi:hypothetical protein